MNEGVISLIIDILLIILNMILKLFSSFTKDVTRNRSNNLI